MRRYRSAMDRVQVSPAFHKRLMETLNAANRTVRRPGRALGWAAAAACCALAVILGIGGLSSVLGGPSPTAGVARTPEPVVSPDAPSAPPSPSTTPPPEGEAPTAAGVGRPDLGEPGDLSEAALVVADPFEGQPHSNFILPALDVPNYTNRRTGPGYHMPDSPDAYDRDLQSWEILQILGGGDAVPWTLGWSGFGLWGTATYDGDGRLWEAQITGKYNSETRFALTLAPGAVPAALDVPALAYNGAEVAAYYLRADGDVYSYFSSFLAGDVGVLFFVQSGDRESAAFLTNALVAQYASGGFQLDDLAPDGSQRMKSSGTIPLEQARADDLGVYLPRNLPQRYTFRMARIGLMANQNPALTVRWEDGEQFILVQISRNPVSPALPAANFPPEEVTPQALETRSAGAAALHGPGAGYSFTVDFGDVRVCYLVSGLTPEEAAALVVRPAP